MWNATSTSDPTVFATLLAQLLPDPVWKKTAVSMPGKTAPVA